MASPGGSWLRSEAQQTDEGWQAAVFYFARSTIRTCSPTLIRPFGPPSPAGKAFGAAPVLGISCGFPCKHWILWYDKKKRL